MSNFPYFKRFTLFDETQRSIATDKTTSMATEITLKENEFVVKLSGSAEDFLLKGGTIQIVNPHKDKHDSAALLLIRKTIELAMQNLKP